MKKFLICFTAFAAFSLFAPLGLVKHDAAGTPSRSKEIRSSTAMAYAEKDAGSFKVRLNDGKTVEVPAQEYVLGCIAGEMPLSFEEEALKAQGIAAYTFALYKKERAGNDYDITADYNIDQCYLTDDELKAKWGDGYEENKNRLKKIVSEIKGKYLCYEGSLALCVYHSVSSGVTYSSKEVWGKAIPYLESVDSSYDKLCEDYKKAFTFSAAEFYERLGLEAKKSGETTIETKASANGRITSVSVDGKDIEPGDFAKKLGLRSLCFQVTVKDKEIKTVCFGWGHGVGMSQNGANALAKTGSTYKEILHHYYSGCSIKNG